MLRGEASLLVTLTFRISQLSPIGTNAVTSAAILFFSP